MTGRQPVLRVGRTEIVLLAVGEVFRAPWPVSNFDTFDDRLAAARPDLRRMVSHVMGWTGAVYYVLWWGDREFRTASTTGCGTAPCSRTTSRTRA